jgi:hypothetical protein
VPDRTTQTTQGNSPAEAIFYTVPLASPALRPFPYAAITLDPTYITIRKARIDCLIDLDGHPRNCVTVYAPHYSKYFAEALLSWLSQPDLRYRPMTLNGVPIAGHHVFDYQMHIRKVRE